jgi:hypothetical protein
MQLLELSALCLRCEVGRLLCDSRCWEIFQTCHKITCQERVSSLLGNTAGNTLAHIVLMVFSRARQPRTAAQHVSPSTAKSKHKAITAATAATTGSSTAAATAATGVNGDNSTANMQQQQSVHSNAHTEHSANTTTARLHTGNDSDSSSSNSSSADECVLVDGVDTGDDGGDEYTEQFSKEQLSKEQLKSHRRRRRRTNRDHSAATSNGDNPSSVSLNALVEIMRFLSRLSNPRENSEETCILSLSLINIALEAGGVKLGQHKALVEVHKQQQHFLLASVVQLLC